MSLGLLLYFEVFKIRSFIQIAADIPTHRHNQQANNEGNAPRPLGNAPRPLLNFRLSKQGGNGYAYHGGNNIGNAHTGLQP